MNRSQENLKVAFYLRVSTDAQSVVHQRNELEKEGHYRGWKIVGEYVDTSSGARCSRVGIDALMRDIRCHRVRTVACVTLDRLARSMSNFSSVVGEFDLHGVALIVPRQQIDTSDTTPAGRLTMHILMAMAEFQLSLIREATKSGLRAARARGAKIGRPATPLPANHEEIVARWRAETGGKGYRKLAALLGITNPGIAFRLAKLMGEDPQSNLINFERSA